MFFNPIKNIKKNVLSGIFLGSLYPDPCCLHISESAKWHKSLCKPNHQGCQVFNFEPDSLVFEFSTKETKENTSDF